MRIRSLLLLAVAALWLLPSGGAETVDPTSWPEGQRAFYADGPGLLLTEAERAELVSLDEAGREAFIEDFVARGNAHGNFEEALARRLAFAQSLYLSPGDARFQLAFLAGPPIERTVVDCGVVFHPMEIWSYPLGSLAAEIAMREQRNIQPRNEANQPLSGRKRFKGWDEGPQLVLYQPSAGEGFRLWEPYDSKRALYTSEMQYYMEQWENRDSLGFSAARFDVQTCDDTPKVDDATGVQILTRYKRGRPTRASIYAFLEPPTNLERWIDEALLTPVREMPDELVTDTLEVFFPQRRDQRIVSRLMVAIPADVELGLDEDGKADVTVDGVLEEDGQVFDRFRVRFQFEPPADKKVALPVDRALRPGGQFVARLLVRDEIGKRQAVMTGGFEVPYEPLETSGLTDSELVASYAQGLLQAASEGQDGLVLGPPAPGEVILGLWRAEALVTGSSITKVVFLVDGDAQLSRTRKPFSAEIRLGASPREQIVRAEGYAADGSLVASDEVVLNQPRGSFRVRIVSPARGADVSGEVEARAEVVVPDERKVEAVEFRVNDELVATLEKPPWKTTVTVPYGGEVAYVAARAVLDDGLSAEDVRFLNAPEYLEEVEVNLIEVYTTVFDRSGRLIRDLTQDDFEILEDGRPQEITKFELMQGLPLSIGVAIDMSGSMQDSMVSAQRAGQDFLQNVLRRDDHCFVLGFSGKPQLLMPPTDDVGGCVRSLGDLRAYGLTALHDALVTSLYYLREASGQKALVLLSDGDDTSSALTYRESLDFARKAGVSIYTVGLGVGVTQIAIREKLKNLSEETGGRSFFIRDVSELGNVYDEIEEELRSRYLLAYSTGGPPKELYRKVEVKVKRRGLKARTARGYYG